MENNNPTRMTKRVRINPYLDNEANFNWGLFIASTLVVSFTIFSSLLFILYFMQSFDVLKALSDVENTMIVFCKYFASNAIGELNKLNLLNDVIGSKVFDINVEIQSPNLNILGWIIIVLSLGLGLLLHSMSLYQYYIQRLIKVSGYFNYYVPYLLLHKFINRVKTKKIYLRVLPLVKLEKINKTDYKYLIQNLFNISINEVDNYELKIEDKRVLGWFDYKIIHLLEIKNKKGNYEKETISKNNKHSKQSSKVPSNNEKLKGFFE